MPRFTREELLAAPARGFSHEVFVRFQDVDAAGVIFFANALEYCSDALFAGLEAAGYPIVSLVEGRTIVTPVKHAECDYVSPMRFADRVVVRGVALVLRETDFTIGFRIERRDDGRPTALAQTHQVCVDAASFRRTPVPAELAAALAKTAGIDIEV